MFFHVCIDSPVFCFYSVRFFSIQLFRVDDEGVLRIPLPTGNILTLPIEQADGTVASPGSPPPSFADTVESTKMWRNLSSQGILETDESEKNVSPPRYSSYLKKTAEDFWDEIFFHLKIFFLFKIFFHFLKLN